MCKLAQSKDWKKHHKMRTIIYDSDGRQALSNSVSVDDLKVTIDDLEKLTVSIKGRCAATGNFTVHHLALLPLMEEVCHQLASYSPKAAGFSSNLFQAEFRRIVATYSREDALIEEEPFKEHRNLLPQDRTSEKIYKIIDNFNRLKQDIQYLTQIKLLISALQDVVNNLKNNQESELLQLVQSNPTFFSSPEEVTVEEKWARFFDSILSEGKSSSDTVLEELLRSFSETPPKNANRDMPDDD